MKKFLFIMSGARSIPNIKNGNAVAILVEYLLERDEKEKKYNIEVILTNSEESYKASLRYKYLKFIDISYKIF